MRAYLKVLTLAITCAGSAGLTGLGCSSPRSENVDGSSSDVPI